jgi:ferritin-like protein
MPRGGEGLASFKGNNPKHHDKTMQIRTASIGLLFGKGGATLRDVKERSGCVDIWIDQERANRLGLKLCDVVLRGEPKATTLAKRLIEEKLRSNTSKTIQIPTGRIGAILGKGAATIKKLKALSGCNNIYIDQDRANSEGSEVCDVLLQGEPKAIAHAQELIEKKIGGDRTIQIPSECIGTILANIQELKERSGCHIWVGYERANREGSELCDVSLHGDPATFALAQRLIKETVGGYYHFEDSASDAGSSATSMSSMSIDSTGWSQEKSAEPPSAVAAWPALPGARASIAATSGLPSISELERTKSAERVALIERQRREEEQRMLRVRCNIETPSGAP